MQSHNNTKLVLQAYSVFQNNLAYQHKSPFFKKKIRNCDMQSMCGVVNAIRQILTHRTIRGVRDIIRVENLGQIKELEAEYTALKLSEYSQLLALRFIRQTYFQSNYFFMNCVHIQLSSILLAIGLFRKESSDDERGKFLFENGSKLFKELEQEGKKEEVSKELQVIGFSIHKMALQIMHTCGSYIKYEPFHQTLMDFNNQGKQQKMENKMYKNYLKLKQQNVKFPIKFHYFKEGDLQKFITVYKKINCLEHIEAKYKNVFEQIWKEIQKTLSPQHFQQANLDNYLLFFQSNLPMGLRCEVTFYKKIAVQTFDRYFWKGLTQFIQNKLLEIKSFIEMQSLTQQQLRQILSIYLFILFFTYSLLEPQVMYLLQHQFIEELSKLFMAVLKFYGKLSQQKQSNFKYSRSKALINIQGNLNALSALSLMIECFRRIKQFSLQFTHQLHSKGNTVHNYPRITIYCDIILQIKLKNLKENVSSSKLQKEIMNRMQVNHQLYFKKQQFLFIFYEKHNKFDHFSLVREQFQRQIEDIVNNYSQCISMEKISQMRPLVEYIELDDEEISKQQLQGTKKTAKKDTSLLKRLSYCLNRASQSSQPVQQNHRIPQIRKSLKIIKAPTHGKAPSFLQSLKVSINRPSEVLVKSLSSSKKLRNASKGSVQNLRSSYRSSGSSKHLGQSQTSLVIQNKTNGFGSLFFKQALIENYQIPMKQVFQTPVKKSQRIRRRENTATKYINNFIQQNSNSQALPKNRESFAKEPNTQEKSLLILKRLQSKQQNFVIRKPKQPNLSQRQLGSARSLKSIEPQSGSQLCFYFSGKIKKEFLKKKILIKKNTCLQLGMIVNLQQEIIANSSKSKYRLLLKIYITTLVPLLKINTSIRLPAWLQCTSKGNLSKDNMKEHTQFISNFVLGLKDHKESSIKINYAELPMLDVVCVYQNERREAFCQPLYIMINRFSIEKALNEGEMYEIIGVRKKMTGERVHEKIGTTLTHLKHYFTTLSLFSLDIAEKLQLFSQKDGVVGDQLGAIKLQFIQNHLELALIFFQSLQTHSEGVRLFVEFFPIGRQQWGYEQLHILQRCLRSILCDK